MTKQMISFTDPQRQRLTREAERLGISIAELVRRIIDRHTEDQRAPVHGLAQPRLTPTPNVEVLVRAAKAPQIFKSLFPELRREVAQRVRALSRTKRAKYWRLRQAGTAQWMPQG